MRLKSQPEIVDRVQEVLDLVVLQSAPPTLYVRVSGAVTTSGRSNGFLTPRVYSTPPEDRIQEFDFVADLPRDMVLQVESQILGECVLHELPDWVRGVRIVALSNQIEQLFPNTSDPLADEVDEKAVACQVPSTFSPQCHAPAQSLLVTQSEGYARQGPPDAASAEFLLGSVSVPETRSQSETRPLLRDPISGKTVFEAEVPVLYRRVARQRLLAKIHYGSAQPARDVLRDHVQAAVAAGIAIDVLMSGNLTVAAAALQAELRRTLAASLGEAAAQFLVELRRETMPGPWTRL